MLHRRLAISTVLTVLAAGCDRPPTEPASPRPRPLSASSGTSTPTINAIDLGVLPGDDRSEATYVTEGGTVYGYSYAPDDSRRAFKWTATAGMQEVAAVPTPTVYPIPSITPPPGGAVRPYAANAKGEATGSFCFEGADPACEFFVRMFRWSRGAGLQDLDPYHPEPGDAPNQSVGLQINRWGHVAGVFRPANADEWGTVLWTPIDSFTLVIGITAFLLDRPGPVLLNDNDRVVSRTYHANGSFGVAWEPGGQVTWLFAPGQTFSGDEAESEATAQNNSSHVVGRSAYWFSNGEDLEFRRRAVLWIVPPVDRSAFPRVDANVYGSSSTPSLARSGGRYYQIYRATQAATAGPYVELVDWGDGATSSRTRSRVGVLTSQNHVYAETGTYWVRVYVEDAQGRWGVSEHKVTVRP